MTKADTPLRIDRFPGNSASVTVTVRLARRLRFRIWMATRLIMLAGWLLSWQMSFDYVKELTDD